MSHTPQPRAEDLNQAVTLGILRQELKRELKRELKKELKNYPTKDELRQELLEHTAPLAREHEKLVKNQEKLSRDIIDLEARMNRKFDDFKIEIISEVKNIVLSSEDRLMGEFNKIHEVLAAGQYRQSEHSDQLEDHEKRLIAIEDWRKVN